MSKKSRHRSRSRSKERHRLSRHHSHSTTEQHRSRHHHKHKHRKKRRPSKTRESDSSSGSGAVEVAIATSHLKGVLGLSDSELPLPVLESTRSLHHQNKPGSGINCVPPAVLTAGSGPCSPDSSTKDDCSDKVGSLVVDAKPEAPFSQSSSMKIIIKSSSFLQNNSNSDGSLATSSAELSSEPKFPLTSTSSKTLCSKSPSKQQSQSRSSSYQRSRSRSSSYQRSRSRSSSYQGSRSRSSSYQRSRSRSLSYQWSQSKSASKKRQYHANSSRRQTKSRSSSRRYQSRSPSRRYKSRSPLRRYKSRSSSRRIDKSRSSSRRRDKSRSPSRRRDKSRSPSRRRDKSRSPSRRIDKSRSPSRRRDKSKSPSRRRDKSRSPSRRIDKSRSSSRRRDKSRSPSRRRDKSRSSSRRRDKSRSPSRRRDKSRSPSRRRDKSRSPSRRRDKSRSPSRRIDKSRSSSRNQSKNKSEVNREASSVLSSTQSVVDDSKTVSLKAYTKLCEELSTSEYYSPSVATAAQCATELVASTLNSSRMLQQNYTYRDPFTTVEQKTTHNLVFHNSVWKTPTQAVLDGATTTSVGPIQHFPVSDGRQHIVPDTSGTDSTSASNSEQVVKSQPLAPFGVGVFTGTTTISPLDREEHERGFQAWTKKNMFENLKRVRGGFGEAMMKRMGWKEGTPLGKSGVGHVEPIVNSVKLDRRCLSGEDSTLASHMTAMVPPSNEDTATTSTTPIQTSVPTCTQGLYAGKHPVSVLHELATKKRWDIQYDMVECGGPAHSRQFKFKVTTPLGSFVPDETSNTKKAAKALAALLCLNKIGLTVS